MVLQLLQFQVIDELSRHEVTLFLFLPFVLKVTANDVENAVFESEAVADAPFVANSGYQDVLSLGVGAGDNPTHILHEVLLHEDYEEHLVHRDEAVRLVDVLEAKSLQVVFNVLHSLRHLSLQTLLRGQENHVVFFHFGEERPQLLREKVSIGAAHIPSDSQDL